MKTTLGLIGIVLGISLLVALGGGLFVIVAYGVGWLLMRFLPFSPFEATLLSLVGMSVAGLMAWRVVSAFISSPTVFEDEDLDNLDFEDEAWDETDEDEEADEATYPGVPRWRQPLKKLDFSNVEPDDHCPCGSGRKYKNCHGRKAKA